jgi:hypothetical protein
MGTIMRNAYPQELEKKGLLLKSESPVTERVRINPH